MAFAIYKPGQGYWTRMLTAIGTGIVVMATVGWLWAELDSGPFAVEKPYTMTLAPVPGEVKEADPMSRWGLRLEAAEVGDGALRIEDLASGSPAIEQGFSRDDVVVAVGGQPVADRLALATAISALGTEEHLVVEVTRSESIVLYVQAGVAVAVIVIAGVLLWLIMNRPRAVDFMIATEAEMRKVNWPSKNEIRGSTLVVVCGTIILAVFLWTINLVFGWLFIRINILEG